MTVTAQNAYNISHLIIVFWGPVLIMMFSYVIIAYKLMQYALQGVQAKPETARKETTEEETPPDVQDALLSVKVRLILRKTFQCYKKKKQKRSAHGGDQTRVV